LWHPWSAVKSHNPRKCSKLHSLLVSHALPSIVSLFPSSSFLCRASIERGNNEPTSLFL
jgi:hypothetical protein